MPPYFRGCWVFDAIMLPANHCHLLRLIINGSFSAKKRTTCFNWSCKQMPTNNCICGWNLKFYWQHNGVLQCITYCTITLWLGDLYNGHIICSNIYWNQTVYDPCTHKCMCPNLYEHRSWVQVKYRSGEIRWQFGK